MIRFARGAPPPGGWPSEIALRLARRLKFDATADADADADAAMVRSMLALLLHAAAASNEFGKKFLASNAGKVGVTTLPSGLQYKVLREGDGEFHPAADSECECHYEGRTAQVVEIAPRQEV